MPLIGNKVAEKDLRGWLQAHGYFGRSAKVFELELVALRRPGWEQVFQFRVRAKRQDESDWDELRGLFRDDERKRRFEARLTTSDEDHAVAFAEWTDGMILPQRRTRGTVELSLIFLAVVILATVVAVVFLRRV
ncbi:MAG: hypothetical protein M3552_05255 [Planctomycetota bacterium]|nr:hypothetical protein [Planctomycetota bacterium]